MSENVIIILGTHLMLAALSLRKVWRNRARGNYLEPLVWSVFAILIPLMGPLFTLAFAKKPKHDDSFYESEKGWNGRI